MNIVHFKSVIFGNLKTIHYQCPKCELWQFKTDICECGFNFDNKDNVLEKERPEIRCESPTWRTNISNSKKQSVYERDEYICQYCGTWCFDSWIQDPKSITIDHIFPFSAGGNNKVENLITCCMECNLIKSNKIFETFEDARDFIKESKKNG